MWSSNGITIVWCFMLFAVAFGLPATKIENDSLKPDPIESDSEVLPGIELSLKPTDNSKPNEFGVDAKPMEAKPTEVNKPNDSAGPTTTIFESIPMNLTPARPQMLYDQRQDGKYNIRADLENFVILVVPSTGSSLLDLLKRSSLRQQQQQQQQQHNKRVHQTKHHKKYPAVGASGSKQDAKKGGNRLDYLNGDGSEATPAGIEAFIEGRTPYHVDISSDEIEQPSAYSVRSFSGGNGGTIADIPLVNLDETSSASSSSSSSSAQDSSDATLILSTLSGKSSESKQPIPRLSKSLIIDGYGANPFTNFNTVVLTRPAYATANQFTDQKSNNNNGNDNSYYNNYYSRNPSVQILDINAMGGQDHDQDPDRNANLLNAKPSHDVSTDLIDSKTSFNSLNVGNIALAGDSSAKTDSDLANDQWELTLLGAEEQCGPDRRRDSYGVCQFVPADYATT